jgi:hypothetical protein
VGGTSDLRAGEGVYLVRLLYAEPPQVDAARWAVDTAVRFGGPVEVMGPAEESLDEQASAVGLIFPDEQASAVGLIFPDEQIDFAEGSMPMQVWMLPDAPGSGIDVDDDLLHSWEWPDAAAAVARAGAAVAVTDLMGSVVEPQRRLRVFVAAVAGLVLQARPLAIQWWPAQRIVDPETFLLDQAADPFAFDTAVHVRNFTIADGVGESIMDTMGMSKLGLPDVQVNFRGRDLDDMAGRIHGTARYLFDHGDVIEDGETVFEERWRARHEVALAEPERVVLDLDPGDIPR